MLNDYKYREEQNSSSINQRVSIDSCAFRIPLEISVPSSSQGQAICNNEGRYIQNLQTIDTETGQVMHEHEKPGAQNFTDTDEQTGEIYTRYWIRSERHEGKDLITCLNIGLHSKHLLHDYFEGITQNTIAKALTTILDQGHFSFDISQAISQGRFTQTDLKRDTQMSYQEYKSLCQKLIESTKESKYQAKTAKKWQQGIEWGNRDSKKHYKTYHKSKQMLAEHKFFTETYLKGMHQDLVRFETKIAGAKDFKQLGLESNRAEVVLKANQQQLTNIMYKQFAQVLDIEALKQTNNETETAERISDRKVWAFMWFDELTKKGYGLNRIVNLMSAHRTEKASRSKLKNQLIIWYNEWLETKCQDMNFIHFFDEIFST